MYPYYNTYILHTIYRQYCIVSHDCNGQCHEVVFLSSHQVWACPKGSVQLPRGRQNEAYSAASHQDQGEKQSLWLHTQAPDVPDQHKEWPKCHPSIITKYYQEKTKITQSSCKINMKDFHRLEMRKIGRYVGIKRSFHSQKCLIQQENL